VDSRAPLQLPCVAIPQPAGEEEKEEKEEKIKESVVLSAKTGGKKQKT